MKGLNILVLLFYTLIIVIVATVLIALSLDMLTFEKIIHYYQLYDLKLITGVVGVALIIINFIVLRITFAGFGGRKSIRFKTRDGLITVSLNAIEGLTRHLSGQLPEIKDMHPRIFANRRGIEVLIKTTFYSNASIPEVTEKIQHYIKTKLQETLGAEKNITVKIQVDKIEQTVTKL